MVQLKNQNDTMKKHYIIPASSKVDFFVEGPLAQSFGKHESDTDGSGNTTTTGASDGLTNRKGSEWNSSLWSN